MTETFGGTRLHVGDIVVIALYFVFILVIGLWTSRTNRSSAGGYFLAGRSMHWIPVGASLFASNIGSLHFVGLAGSGAAAGISIANYELNAMLVLILLAYVFLPIYISSGVYTMPQYLQRRFGGKRIQIFLSALTLIMYIFTKISADLYSGSIFIEQALNWDMYGAVCLLLGIAAIFTITGGLTAVIWTDFFQTIIMLIGSFVLMVISFNKVGGFNAMVEKYPEAIPRSSFLNNNTCGKPRQDYMHLFRHPLSSDLPWPGLLGMTINSIWYWCSDQVIVQRALAAKTITHARAGALLCGFLKILPLFLLVFPGMIARILFPETVGCTDPAICDEVCGSPSGCTNTAYPTLVIELLPTAGRGMMLAVMLAALMSSLTSIFNSSSTIFAMDVWKYIRKSASEMEIMLVGRSFVVVLVVISIIWIPVIKASQGTQLYVYVQEVSSFLQPPICAIFLLGVFWERINEKGAFYGMLIGFLAGIVRFAIQYSYTTPPCGSSEPDHTPGLLKNFHYLYFSVFLFVLTALATVVISLLTKPIDKECLLRLTYGTRHSKQPRKNIDDGEPVDQTLSGEAELGMELPARSKLQPAAQSQDEGGDTKNHADNGVIDVHETDTFTSTRSIPACIFNWVCGINSSNKVQLSTKHVDEDDMISILEPPSMQLLSAIMAALLAFSAIFLLAFYA